MNKTQKNFRKEVTKALYIEEKKAKKGKGAFSNNLFSLRFYGYNNSYDYTHKPIIIRFFLFALRLVFFIVRITFLLVMLLLIIALVYVIRNNVNGNTVSF